MRKPAEHLAAMSRAAVIATLLFNANPPMRAAATPAVQWRELRTPMRFMHTMVWDSRRQRALMFGGVGDFENLTPYPGVWQLVSGAAPHWEPFDVAGGGPPPRSGMCAVYDSLRDRVLVFGGLDSFGSNELWQLSLAGSPAWSLLDASAGATPPARWSASMVLDAQDRLVLYGGQGNTANDPDVYLLPLGVEPLAWQDLALAGPGPRARHGAVFSPVTHRMSVFGGDVFNGVDPVLRPAETWELVLDEPIHWVKRASAPGDSVPIPETGGALVADRAGNFAWLIPGAQDPAHDASVWRLDLVPSTWTRVQNGAGGPDTRSGVASTLDPSTGEVLVHGGIYSIYAVGLIGTTDGTMETWRFKPGDPTPWASAAPAPRNPTTSADSPRMLLDEATRTLFRHDARGVWTCDLGTDAAWRLDPAGIVNAPTAVDPVSVIDPLRRRMLVFGGASVVANQLWSWPLDGPGAWTVTPIAGTPPMAIRGNQRAYDPARDRVILIPANIPPDTVATLELGGGTPQWVPLATQGGPPHWRSEAPVAIDAARDRLVLGGGMFPDADFSLARDLWTLDLSGTPQWTLRIPDNFDPGIRARQGMLLDPDQDRALLLGGFGQGIANTLYGSPLATLSAWTNLDPDDLSPMWGQGVAFYDAAARRGLFWNGTLWEITWPGSSSAPPDPPLAHGLALAPPRPNPARDHVTLVVETASAGEVAVEVFDTAGRRVGGIQYRLAAAGRSEFAMPLPHGLAPGVYLVRARQGANTAHARLAITR